MNIYYDDEKISDKVIVVNKKVKIPKDVAEAIEHIQENSRNIHFMYFTNWDWMKARYPSLFQTLSNFFENFPHEYIRAIKEGYDIELTPEEKIIDLFKREREKYTNIFENDKQGRYVCAGRIHILEDVIKILGLSHKK